MKRWSRWSRCSPMSQCRFLIQWWRHDPKVFACKSVHCKESYTEFRILPRGKYPPLVGVVLHARSHKLTLYHRNFWILFKIKSYRCLKRSKMEFMLATAVDSMWCVGSPGKIMSNFEISLRELLRPSEINILVRKDQIKIAHPKTIILTSSR